MDPTTTSGGSPVVPDLTLGWRLQMALGLNDTSKQDMADALGVNRATVSRWMHDRGAPPRRAYILQWAQETGVDAAWLEEGSNTCDRCGDTLPYPDIGAAGGWDGVVGITCADVA